MAYQNGFALTSNPYLTEKTQGDLWYWMFGWQDAMADEVREIKALIVSAATPIDRKKVH